MSLLRTGGIREADCDSLIVTQFPCLLLGQHNQALPQAQDL